MTKRQATNYSVVILSNTHWDFLWQRHQIFATHFANTGHRVIFVEGLAFRFNYLDLSYYLRGVRKLWHKTWRERSNDAKRGLPRNLTVYLSLVAPLKPRIFRWVNKRVFVPRVLREIAAMGIQNPVVWSFQPTDTAMQVAKGLEPKALVYDCVANFARMPGVPADISRTEREWLEAADLVLVDSSFLRHKHAGQRPDLVQVTPGVDYELFSRAYSAMDLGGQIQRICFFGGMDADWFDFDLVESIANAGFRVSLIGYSAKQHRLFDHPNVEYTPPVPQVELPLLLKPMDALVIPYRLNDFTRGIFPTKVYECLATGKPVVATPLPDLQGKLSKYIYLASNAEEFIEVLRRLPELETQEKVQARLALAQRNSWKSRLDLLSRELERLLRV